MSLPREQIETFGTGPGRRLFRSENGNPIQPSAYWRPGRNMRPGADAPLLRRPYDLRHSGFTWRLNPGVPPAEVAGRSISRRCRATPAERRNPACKAVLVGLANHAAPDGTAAFPAVRTLVRYTELSERTVRTALDRLAAEGIIQPCDPAIVAAKIKRADQRPQGWDLAMHFIRDDLDDEDLAALERQFPGLTARAAILRTAGGMRQDDPSSCTRTVL